MFVLFVLLYFDKNDENAEKDKIFV